MNIIDSSFWLEYFAETDSGNIVSEIIENTDELIIQLLLYMKYSKNCYWKQLKMMHCSV
jgi:hypothetical protein